MIAHLSQSFIFESAHTLKRQVPVEEFQSSMRVHGHTYTAEVTLSGEVESDGMIQVKRKGRKREPLDLHLIRAVLASVKEKLDHRMLDDVPNLGNPTLENICMFIGADVVASGLPLSQVSVSRPTGDKCSINW